MVTLLKQITKNLPGWLTLLLVILLATNPAQKAFSLISSYFSNPERLYIKWYNSVMSANVQLFINCYLLAMMMVVT